MNFRTPVLLAFALMAGAHGIAQAAPTTIEFTGSVGFFPDGPCSVCAQIYTDFTRDSGLSASGTSSITGTITIEQDATPYPFGGAPGLYGTAVLSASLKVGNLVFTSAPEATGITDAAYGSGQTISIASQSLAVGIGNDSFRWWEQSRLSSDHIVSPVNARMAYYWRDFSTSLANNVSSLFGSLDLNDFAGQLAAIDVSALTTRNFHAGIEFIDPTFPYAVDSIGDPLYFHYNPSLSLNGLLTGIRIVQPTTAGSGSGAASGALPEPGTMSLLGLGLVAAVAARRRHAAR